MRTIERPRVTDGGVAPPPATCLVAFLPGMGDGPEDYAERGWVEAMHEAGVDADAILLDSHFGYVREETILTRIREDVLAPAEARGYDQIWLVGISLGGALSATTSTAESDRIAGAVLFAPYLGGRSLSREIRDAGGLARWDPGYDDDQPAYREDGSPTFRRIFEWLGERTRSDGSEVPVYLAFGTEDRGREAHELVAETLPRERVITSPGGHRWTVWTPLWQRFLATGALRDACAAAPEATSVADVDTGPTAPEAARDAGANAGAG